MTVAPTPVAGGPNFSEYLNRAANIIAAAAGALFPDITKSAFYHDLAGGAFIRRLTSKQRRS